MKQYNLTEKEMDVVRILIEALENKGTEIESAVDSCRFALAHDLDDERYENGMIWTSRFVDKRDIPYENRRSLGGILSNLEKKGVIEIENDWIEYDGRKVNYIWADPEALRIIAGMEDEEEQEEQTEAEEEQTEEVQEEQNDEAEEIKDAIERMFNRMKENYNLYLEGERGWDDADEAQLKKCTRRHWAVNGKNGAELTAEDIEEVKMMVQFNKVAKVF